MDAVEQNPGYNLDVRDAPTPTLQDAIAKGYGEIYGMIDIDSLKNRSPLGAASELLRVLDDVAELHTILHANSKEEIECTGAGVSIVSPHGAISMEDTEFRNNVASSGCYGGGMYVSSSDTELLTFLDRSLFIENEAPFGGGLYARYPGSDEAGYSVLWGEVAFVANKGWSAGGAIYWEGGNLRDQVDTSSVNTSFVGNASPQGPNIASMPWALTAAIHDKNTQAELMLDDIEGLAASGTSLPFDIALTLRDAHGNPMAPDSATEVVVRVVSYSLPGNASVDQYALNEDAIEVIGSRSSLTQRGIAEFSDLGINAVPGAVVTLHFWVNQLSSVGVGVPNVPIAQLQVNVTIPLRTCIPGEVVLGSTPYLCTRCELGTFSVDTSDKACTACPVGGFCPGGAVILATDGYWRRNYLSPGRYNTELDRYELLPCAADKCFGIPR